MSTVGEALREAARRLEAISDTARLDAEVLMAHALGVSRSDLLLRRMAEEAPGGFAALVARRSRHEPVAYIVGSQEFYGREFAVTPDVLIPRADSETTLEAALEVAPGARRVLDCGIGSGALLLSFLAERPEARGVGLDRSPAALAVAGRNAGVSGRSRGVASWSNETGLAPAGPTGSGTFDLVIANPPYVEAAADLDASVRDFEPSGALFAGPEGLDDYRVLLPHLPALLNPGGVAVLEIGAAQAEAVSAIAAAAGFSAVLRKDLAGRPRSLILWI